jgi:glutamyl-tRNA synthetase
LNPDKSKLSKRQGDVAVEDYRDKGYLKEALINFVALLGWNFGDDQEYYLLNEMIEKFSLERVNKAGAVFNIEKLDWLNGLHIRNKSNEEILPLFKSELKKSKYANNDYNNDWLLQIIESMKERINFVKELIDNCSYFYEKPVTYDENIIKKRWKDDSVKLLTEYAEELSKMEGESKEDFEQSLKLVAENNECGAGRIIHPLRLAVSGVGIGPGVYELLLILGKQEVIDRINIALNEIPKQIES